MAIPAIHRVVGTAGHIDHGKTTLVAALTGVDTDRLAEEKRRGITIVLGFAPLDLGDGTTAGLVDVPGHERFVKTMVAGATGIDLALFVVAADEGVMPQTREHVEICELLEIPAAVTALTKCDRADPELAALAEEDVRGLLASTRFAGSQLVRCSARTGDGIEDVRRAVRDALSRSTSARPSNAGPCLPIDRAFSVRGFGSVVTGTLASGTLHVGDLVEVMPSMKGHSIEGPVRVRSIQVFGRDVETAVAGDRTALSLSNVELESLRAGQVVVAKGQARPTRLLDVTVRALASRKKKLKNDAPVTLHANTELVTARMTLLDQDHLEPGATAFARLRLATPIAVLPGQRFVLRGYDGPDAGRTVGGGRVLDPEPPRRRRMVEPTVTTLEALSRLHAEPSPESIVQAAREVVRERGSRGAPVDSLLRRLGLSSEAQLTGPSFVTLGARAFDLEAIAKLEAPVLAAVEAHHLEHDMKGGLSRGELVTRMSRTAPAAALEAAIDALITKKRLEQNADGIRLEGKADRAKVGGDKRSEIERILDAAGLEPPALEDVAKDVKLPDKAFKDLIASMVRSGELVRAGPVTFARRPHEAAKQKVLAHISERGGLTTGDAKSLLGVSRKYLIPFLESLDKANVTVRVGEVRQARKR
ncbi:MAG: selenocysteine-specific translation elongation factor [Deltaproteobacteria bacterium]|nr:selenocysteine-specific translation elongation factor [Deltaproteobacteria bacterium]